MKIDNKRKKIIITTVIIIGVITLALVCAFALLPSGSKIGFTEKQEGIYYFPADYDENIFEDKVYLSKISYMKFDHFGTGLYLDDENYKTSYVTKFFYEYFQTVINGKYEEYKNYFSDSFFRKHSIPERFTMQKIYDIEISALSSEIIDSVVYETYKVGYKIYENNGTFRADMASNECIPVAVTITKGTEIKISSIIPIYASKGDAGK